ncbi:hypothetical protein [Streptococcus acidominimus]|uniref:Lipoprotein n=1 Tax=Streptococcus acidominimus TaxID=1326 RepID=A0A4Y9FM90_STRAI|nr:hypothetical protein [Streptococcus acidominimus]MBF0819787.1 hypothetical protein [Streptococcus acidominimus]MBF0838182.1 hypothetical protein [Streptococcus acidominimus]MBF0846509.1 hypothetical protein [Streptococcus danieliae]TFU29449.1 hypothetical protein E4U01_10060 [Streptococcus acidominimus]
MKKILLAFASVVVAVFLTACGSNKDSLEGEYHLYWVASNTGEKHLDGESAFPLKIENSMMKGAHNNSDDFIVDEEKSVFISESGREYPYTYKDGVLVFNGDQYYKVDTKAYQEKKKEIENQKKD